MYLSRAIHAANQRSSDSYTIRNEHGDKDKEANAVDIALAGSTAVDGEELDPLIPRYKHEKDHREAVVHTIDVVRKHSESAAKMIKGFRRGMYRDAIEFHIGDVSEWIDTQFKERESVKIPFLSHILLDMPATNRHVEKAASALKVNGSLIVFTPSITQITSIVSVIKRQYLPLQLDQVVELGKSMTGGREWDVRAVKPRALTRAQDEVRSTPTESGGVQSTPRTSDDRSSDGEPAETERHRHEEAGSPSTEDKDWEMVCRPKVGERVVGGGFLGVIMPSASCPPRHGIS